MRLDLILLRRPIMAAALFTAIVPTRAFAEDSNEPVVISEPPTQPPTPDTEPPLTSLPGTPDEPISTPPDAEPEKPAEPLGVLRVGGGLGLGFASDYFFVTVEPQVSYLIKRIVEPGISFVYQYSNDSFFEPNVKRNTFGARLFTRFYPIRQLFLLVEGEIMNTRFTQGDFTSGAENFGNLFFGGGYVMGLGKGAFFAFSIKVNVFRTDLYPDHFPIFGIGAGYGF